MNNVRPTVLFYGWFKCTGNALIGTVFFDLFKELKKNEF
jgi:hypothetical protein